jgi:acyl-CoA reductase-like NAD-dependent aldehyde dehydrogenase
MQINFDKSYGPLINGVFETDDKSRSFAAVNAATGTHLAYIRYCDATDVDRAVDAAHAAFPAWRALGQQMRARLVNLLADEIEEHSERLTITVTSLNQRYYLHVTI